MNEQIKKLVEQATKHYPAIKSSGEFSTFDKEKFAELIIQECIQCGNVLAKCYIDNHPEQEQVMLLAAIADYSNEIKKHFGVK